MDLLGEIVELFERHRRVHEDNWALLMTEIGVLRTQNELLIEKVNIMSDALDTGLASIATDITGLTSVVDSTTKLLTDLSAKLAAALAAAAAAGATPAQLAAVTALHTSLTTETTSLAAAVAANTPAAPGGAPSVPGGGAGPSPTP